MKTAISLFCVVIASTTLALAGVAGFLTKKSESWNFIQSVGGMKVSADGAKLNVECDVSGTKTTTIKPTMINSGIGVRKLKHKRDGNTIQLTLVTSVLEKGMKTSCSPLDLSAYPDGEYTVEYLDPDGKTHPLGKVVLRGEKDQAHKTKQSAGKGKAKAGRKP